jgi:hypothetical protein
MKTDVSTQQCKRRRYYGKGDVIQEERFWYELWVGSGDRSGADVCIWLRTPFEVGRLSSYRKLWEEHVSLYGGRWRHSIVGAGKWRVNDVYADVPLWSASGPIAWRWIVTTCVWKLSDCKNWSECWKVVEDCHKRSCWKNSIGVSVPRPCGSDVYVCSKCCWLCLTVVYWLLECNKVPSWIENPEYVTIPLIM